MQESHLMRDNQQLLENLTHLRQEPSAKISDCVVVRMRICRYKSKWDQLIRRRFELARRTNIRCVTIEQKRNQHLRVIGCTSTTSVAFAQLTQVALLYYFDNEPRQIFLRSQSCTLNGIKNNVSRSNERKLPDMPILYQCSTAKSPTNS
jgi:hypothetical protein